MAAEETTAKAKAPKRKAPKKAAAGKGGDTKKKAKKKKKPQPKGWAAYTEKKSVPGWVTAARTVLVLALCATIPMLLGVDEGRRLFWAAMIAILPFFWVVGGYHLWRRICPLAVMSQVPRYLGVGGSRTLKKTWLANRYFGLQLTLMVIALTLRLVATNGTIWALVGFLVVAVLAAVIIGALYTGKTWCNYICPVGMVEKFYTEPSAVAGNHRAALPNSQCNPCTACKKNCPDIDIEQGYWKELDQPSRRLAYYAWPGLVFAFYFYYWLIAGDWDYYFSGIWTLENDQVDRILGEGLFFMQGLPVIVAAPLTLIAFGAVSYGFFHIAEKLALGRAVAKSGDDVSDVEREALAIQWRHKTIVTAGFIGFIIFYFYGGQPTVRRLPGWFGEIFAVLVAVAATAIWLRRVKRTEEDFVKERFATKLLKRWNWGDKPERLQDAVLVHAERDREQKARLQAYKETVREILADGVVTSGELVILEGLRAQLGISDKDHDRVLGELTEEERQLFDPEYQGSIELRLQANQYRRELELALVAAARAGRRLIEADLAPLREEHSVGMEEQNELLAEMLADDGPVAALLLAESSEMVELATAHLEASQGARGWVGVERYQFVAYLCRWRAVQRLENAFQLLVPLRSAQMLEPLTGTLDRQRGAMVATAKGWRKLVTALGHDALDLPAAASGLRSAIEVIAQAADTEGEKLQGVYEANTEAFAPLFVDVSAHVRAGTLHALARSKDATVLEALKAATRDESPLARETAYAALAARGAMDDALRKQGEQDSDAVVRASAARGADAPTLSRLDPDAAILALTTLEKMALLRQAPLFERLEPHDLERMTRITREESFAKGEAFIQEGQLSDDVYVIVSGEAEAYTDSSGERVVLGRSGPGTCIGEMAAFDNSPRSASVAAITRTRTLVVDGDDFQAMLNVRPEMARSIIELLVRRLRSTIAAKGSQSDSGPQPAPPA